MSRAVFYHPPIDNIPLVTVPLAFLHLGTALQGGEHTIEIIDGRVDPDPTASLRRAVHDADVVLISAMPGSQIASALAACAVVREVRPDLPIVWGGPHPSVDPERTIASPRVDAVLVGRGEFTLAALLGAIGDPEAMARVPNLLFKDARGDVIRTARVTFADRKPRPPDFGLLEDVEPYVCQTRRSRRMLDYISSFGCPHTCTFCSEPVTSGSRWAAMDAPVLADHIQALASRYDIDGVLFQDAKFVTDRRRLREFCGALVDRGTGINWIATACGTDIMPLHEAGVLALMRKSGCEQLFIGAEASSADTLVKYHKTVAGEETRRMARLLWEEYDILPHFSYVLSYPMESMDQVRSTLELHQSICEIVKAPTGELGIYNPVPQTAFFRSNAHHFHAADRLEDWAQFNYYGQRLYADPSRDLERLLFQHHIKIRRMFPHVDSYKTFDVWQDRRQVPSPAA